MLSNCMPIDMLASYAYSFLFYSFEFQHFCIGMISFIYMKVWMEIIYIYIYHINYIYIYIYMKV